MSIFKEDSFFSAKEREGANYALYRGLRDAPGLKRDRDAIEELYVQFRPFLGDKESQIAHQLAQHPNSLIWHFSLMKFLERNGFSFEKARAKGPDILASLGEIKICVEAVAPQMGKVPARHYVEGISIEYFTEMDWKVVSRISQQIQTKIENNQTVAGRIPVLAISAHGVDRAYLKKFMHEILFSGKSSILPNGASIKMDFGTQLFEAGYKFVIYTDHDPLIYFENLETHIEIYDLSAKAQILSMEELNSVMSMMDC